MAECDGVVTGLDGSYALVAVSKASACGNCEDKGSCGTGLFAEMGGKKVYRVVNSEKVGVGDHVVLSSPAGTVAKAALLSYLGPLALALIGGLAGNGFGGDAGAAAGVVLGLVLSVPVLSRASRHLTRAKEPMLVMRVKRDVISLHRNTGS